MKYIISESRLDKFIYDYLSSFYEPDHGWQDHKWYLLQAKMFGDIYFNIDNEEAFGYILRSSHGLKPKTLLINPPYRRRLDDLFGYTWDRIFVQWFQDMTGLPVENTITFGGVD